MTSNTGTVIIKGLPDQEIRKNVLQFLSQHVKNLTPDKIEILLEQSPIVLNRKVPLKTGQTLVERLKTLGAIAEYLPNAPSVESNNRERDPFGRPRSCRR